MGNLSWSQLTMHESCPFSWYASYVMKLKPPTRPIQFVFGSAIHEAIEQALYKLSEKGGVHLSVTDILRRAVLYMKEEGIVDPDELQFHTLNAMNSLGAWHRWVSTVDLDIISTEKFRSKPGFVGVVDCVALVDGQLTIIDWKTSSRKYSQKQTDEDGQLTAYLWVTDMDPKETEVAQGVLIKGLSQFQFIKSRRTQQDIEMFLERLQTMRDLIKSYKGVDDPIRKKGSHCERCDVWKMGFCEGMDDF